jgi:erythronate-4-phosphate dehydrogenase
VLINTARGDVVDNAALRRVLQDRADLQTVLDVWENEPLIDVELAPLISIATPHIAGYSHDGKVRGTWMIYQALCAFLQRPATLAEVDLIPPVLKCVIDVAVQSSPATLTALDLVRCVYPIWEDDANLRATLASDTQTRASAFDGLRKHYRVRREFATVGLQGLAQAPQLGSGNAADQLQALGFRLE